jgi:hypothetical protein
MKKFIPLLGVLLFALSACDSASATPTLVSATNFQDDFSKNTGFWQTFTEPTTSAKISEGTLNMSVTAPFTVGVSVAALNMSDFDFTVTTTQVGMGSANGYGMVFRYVDTQNFYRFDIGGDGKWAMTRRIPNDWKHITDLKSSPAIKSGNNAVNTLRVVARGNTFEFYANGVLLDTVTDNTLPLGRIGLFASTFDDAKADVKFDNVKVTKP